MSLTCRTCGHDRDLVLGSISALSPPSTVMVEVGYSCRACRRHYLHHAYVAAVAAVLNRESTSNDVLTFAGHYIHCGQPMQKTGSETRRFNTPSFTDRAAENALDVYLTTQVLHCPCGFQMELPE
ncbi:hypothetical protein QF031_002067 [Pseudarthrobacter defluvii]|uniref:hypothetical protein n=1 Tax=Pseudarthrobacter defluvii TaxID=410837 RepID=UPI002788DBC7|nr:hypothetical protein [Pseudarthrobacter defluvii]MDQ0769318.1 hypothetical protein [Pseudarthrobacter defluvii]